MRDRRELAPLRYREFRLFFLGQLVSGLGDRLLTLTLVFAALEVTGSAAAVGAILASRLIPTLAFLLLGGVIGDRHSRRLIALSSDAARVVIQAVTGALLITHSLDFAGLLVLTVTYGVANAFFQPSVAGLIPSTVPPPHLQSANALYSLTASLPALIGPAAAGFIVAGFGPGWGYLVDALSFAVSVVCFALMTQATHSPSPALRRRAWSDLTEGWHEVRRHAWLLGSIARSAIWNSAAISLSVVGPVLALEHYGGPYAWGLVVSCGSLGALAGDLVSTNVRPRRPIVVANLLLPLYSFPFLLLLIRAPLAIVALSAAVAFGLPSITNTLLVTTMQEQVPSSALSRVNSFDLVGSLIVQPIALTAAGLATHGRGPDWVLVVASVILVFSPLVYLLVVPDARRVKASYSGMSAAAQT